MFHNIKSQVYISKTPKPYFFLEIFLKKKKVKIFTLRLNMFDLELEITDFKN